MMFHWERWLCRERVTVSVSCHPNRFAFVWTENGARDADHGLDTSVRLGPWTAGLIVWRLGRWSWLTRFLPLAKDRWGRRRVGWQIGWWGQ